mmetsp:Transcript_75978/g.197701  ORF Transcript_75978/g.197701 Transcript_75978/m.197701 type:complete len:215 (-) Transcript_75978:30-674(-)
MASTSLMNNRSLRSSRYFPSSGSPRARCGAETSAPTRCKGSLARTTQRPSCETLKLKFGSPGGKGDCRNGLPPFVRQRLSVSKSAAAKTRAHALRARSRPISARLWSRKFGDLSTPSLSGPSGSKCSKNWNSSPRAPPNGFHAVASTAQRHLPSLSSPHALAGTDSVQRRNSSWHHSGVGRGRRPCSGGQGESEAEKTWPICTGPLPAQLGGDQ